MKINNYVLAIALSVFGFAACDQTVETPAPETKGRVIEFESEIGTFTKASGTAFEEGDVIGLSVSAPVSVSNVRLTSTGGALKPESPIYWAENQGDNDKADFVALYPYSQSADPAKPVQVSIPEDLAAAGAYAATDLIGAKTSASPADQRVRLSFGHLLSRMVVTVHHAEGVEVKSIILEGTKVQGTVDIAASRAAASGDAQAVKPAKATVADTYVWLVVPQTAEPVIALELSDGKTYRFTASAPVEFAQGKQVSSTISAGVSAEIKFDADIVDWSEIEIDLTSGEQGGGQGFVKDGYYLYYGKSEEDLIPMEIQDDGTYAGIIPVYQGNPIVISMFKSLDESNASYRYGATVEDAYGINEEVRVTVGGYIFYVEYQGTLKVIFNPAKLAVRFEETGWKVLGTGQMLESFMDVFSGVKHEVFDVEISGNEYVPGLYRVENPYKNSKEWEDCYYEGGYFVVDATDADRVYIPGSYPLGLDLGGSYGKTYIESYVPENGWNVESWNYGYLSEGVVYLPSRSCVLTLDNYGKFICNREGFFQLVLPGAQRTRFYTSFNSIPEFESTSALEDGSHFANYKMNLGMDAKSLRYIVYSGRLDRAEIVSRAIPAVRSNAEGVATVQDVPVEEDITISIPYSTAGVYTVLFYAEGPVNNSYVWQFQSDLWDIEGSEKPEFDLAVKTWNHDKMPDRFIQFHIDFPALDTCAYAVVPKSVYLNSGYTENDYYDYAFSFGTWINNYYFSGKDGTDYMVPAQPSTEYLVIVSGIDVYGRSGVKVASVTSADNPEFEELGTGKYYDRSGIIAENYVTDVKILKTKAPSDYYHVDKVYENYWPSADDATLSRYYPQFRSDSFDFFFREDSGTEFIFYTQYIPGYVETGLGDAENGDGLLILEHRDLMSQTPSKSVYCINNVRIADGVYSIAPYGMLQNTNYMYPFYQAKESFVLAMPGYEYTAPSQNGAAIRKNAAPRNLVEKLPAAPVRASVVAPDGKKFTRHAFKTGAPMVRSGEKGSVRVLDNSVSTISKK